MICSKHSHRPTARFGISLLEVIACTAIVAVMIVPIASVIRASGRSISRSSVGSTEMQLRGGMRWLREKVRTSDVLDVRGNRLELLLDTGDRVQFRVQSDRLIMDDGRDEIVVLEDVTRIEFRPINQLVPPGSLIGISIQLTGRDPASGAQVNLDSIVSIPPQF